MDLIEGLKSRRSIRRFKPELIPDDILWNILRLANAAPSAGNIQAREFIVIRDGEVKEKLAIAAFNQKFVREAPVIIVVCGNIDRSSMGYGKRGKKLYSIQDADAAVMHILLAAHALDMGTCWVGAFDDEEVKKVLDIPEYIRPIAIIPLGYPKKIPEETRRIKIEKLVHFDKW
jgi:nitroreductase